MSQQLVLSTAYVLRYVVYDTDESILLSTMIADTATGVTLKPILQSLDNDADWADLPTDPRIMLVTYGYGAGIALDYDTTVVSIKPVIAPARALAVAVYPLNAGIPCGVVEIRCVHSIWRGAGDHRFPIPPVPPPA